MNGLLYQDLKVRSLSLKNFMKHTDWQLKLPRTGTVVVIADSGSGKSSIIDAVKWALDGTVLRKGGRPRPRGATDVVTEVTLVTSHLDITRTLHKSKQTLQWGHPGKPPNKFGTASAASKALALEVGNTADWATRNVFNPTNLMYFSDGVDKERKQFIEAFLNMREFDRPHAAMLAKVKEATAQEEAAEQDLARAKGRLEGLEDAADEEPTPRPPGPANSPSVYREQLKKLREGPLAAAVEEAQRAVTQVTFELRKADEWAHAFGEDGTCASCGSRVDAGALEASLAQAEKLRAKRKKLRAKAEEAEEVLAAKESSIKAKLREATEAEEELADWLREERKRKARAAERKDKREKLEAAVVTAEQALEEAKREVAFYKDCAFAVSTRGVRAWATADVLDDITRYANEYLGMLGAPFTVRVLPQTVRDNGNVDDEIDFVVEGAGDGNVKAASDGERVRIGFAVKLAISALYNSDGTLFLDEVFAHLNDGHIEGFADVIRDISQHRCVVVITHNMKFAEALGGKVVRL